MSGTDITPIYRYVKHSFLKTYEVERKIQSTVQTNYSQ